MRVDALLVMVELVMLIMLMMLVSVAGVLPGREELDEDVVRGTGATS